MRAEGELPRRGKRGWPGPSAPTIFTGSGASVSEALCRNRSHKGSNLNSITHQGWAVARTEYRKRSCLSRAAPFSFFLHLAALPFAGRYASPLGGSPQCAHWGIGARDSPPRARLRRLRFAISSELNLSFFASAPVFASSAPVLFFFPAPTPCAAADRPGQNARRRVFARGFASEFGSYSSRMRARKSATACFPPASTEGREGSMGSSAPSTVRQTPPASSTISLPAA